MNPLTLLYPMFGMQLAAMQIMTGIWLYAWKPKADVVQIDDYRRKDD